MFTIRMTNACTVTPHIHTQFRRQKKRVEIGNSTEFFVLQFVCVFLLEISVPTVETHFLVFVCRFFCLITLYFIKFSFFVVFGLKNDCIRCYCFFIWIFIEFGRSLLPFGFDQIKSFIWLWIDRFKNLSYQNDWRILFINSLQTSFVAEK